LTARKRPGVLTARPLALARGISGFAPLAFQIAYSGSAELPIGAAGALLVPTARLRIGRVLMATHAGSGVRGLEVGLGLRFGRDG
jgi:hypothetical protein